MQHAVAATLHISRIQCCFTHFPCCHSLRSAAWAACWTARAQILQLDVMDVKMDFAFGTST